MPARCGVDPAPVQPEEEELLERGVAPAVRAQAMASACSASVEPYPRRSGSGWRPSTLGHAPHGSARRARCAPRPPRAESSPSTTQPAAIVADVVVERAGVRDRARPRPSRTGPSRPARPPKAPNEKPPPMYLPNVRMVRLRAEQRRQARAAVARGHHLVGDADRARLAASPAKTPRRKSGSAGMQPPEPSIGSTSTAARSRRARRSRPIVPVEVVVRRDHERVRRVPRRNARARSRGRRRGSRPSKTSTCSTAGEASGPP